MKKMLARLAAIRKEMKDLNEAEAFDKAQWDALDVEAKDLMQKIQDAEARKKALGDVERFLDSAPDPVAQNLPAATDPKPKDHKPVFGSLGEQLQAVATLHGFETGMATDKAANQLKAVNAAAGQNTGIGSEGGFLVQTDFSKTLRETAVETGQLASRCTHQPVGANSDGFEYMEIQDKDRSAGSTFGGLKVYRKGEVSTLTASDKAKMEPREIRLEDMYGLIYTTNRQLRDGVALQALITRGFKKQFGFKLDCEIFEGSGAGECLGFMKSPALVTVAKETDQAAATIVVQNILKMWGAMPASSRANAVWLVSQVGVEEALPQMTIGNQPVYMPPSGLSKGMYGTLLGRPILPIEQGEAIGTKGDIVLADLAQYLLVEKGGIEAAESIHVKFLTDERAFRFIMRNNGQPMDSAPVTTYKGSKKVSPFVALAARG